MFPNGSMVEFHRRNASTWQEPSILNQLFDRIPIISSLMKDLFKLTLDDTAFQRVFGNFEEKLNRHEEMILELHRLLQEKPSRSEMEKMRTEFDQKLKDLENRMIDHIESKVLYLEKHMNMQMSQFSNVSELTRRIESVEDCTNDNTKTVHELKSHVQTIASSFAGISKVPASLDSSLAKSLTRSTDLIVNNFKKLFEGLAKQSDDLTECRKTVQELSNAEPKSFEIDLSDLKVRPGYVASWRDLPLLPQIYKFKTVNEAVAYLYELMPKLQGHITAMHGRIVENTEELLDVIDKETIESLIEKLRRAIVSMNNELGDLKTNLKRNLTKSDVIALISEMMGNQDFDKETAVGTVRCIACGRDMGQVSGASPEIETIKKLGIPINSLTTKVTANTLGQLYYNQDTMISGIVEQPRSIRARSSCKVSRQGKVPRKTAKL